jgi:HAD superfamily hydrolase (TIGR01509 family)
MVLIDTILFDWDGTLVDSAQLSYDAFQKSMRDMGVIMEFSAYERIYSPNWYSMYEALGLPREKWLDADDLWIRHYGQKTSDLSPDAHKALLELRGRGYGLGVVTSGSRSRVHREVNALGLNEVFQIIVCSEDVSNKKPHPEGLDLAMSKLGRPPEFCCYVGDNPDDMEMGKRARVQTIGIASRYPNSDNLRDAGADLCIDSIPQLLTRFKYCDAPASKSVP